MPPVPPMRRRSLMRRKNARACRRHLKRLPECALRQRQLASVLCRTRRTYRRDPCSSKESLPRRASPLAPPIRSHPTRRCYGRRAYTHPNPSRPANHFGVEHRSTRRCTANQKSLPLGLSIRDLLPPTCSAKSCQRLNEESRACLRLIEDPLQP